MLCLENRDKCMGESEVYQAISKLPTANRDTLAFLILHLIRYVSNVDSAVN
jgi:hypothetical protein